MTMEDGILGETKSRVVRRKMREEEREQRIYSEAESRSSWEAATHVKALGHGN